METKQEYKIGDCLELLPEIKDNSIDMILTDLPYGTTACKWDTVIPFEPMWKEYTRIIKDNGAIVLTASQPFTSALIMSNIDMFKYCWIWKKDNASNFFAAKFQPLNDTEDVVVFGHGGCNTGAKNPLMYNPQGIIECNIDKINGTNVGGMLGTAHKIAMKRGKKYTQTVTNYPHKIIEYTRDKNKIHPTQKPISLAEYLIKTYTNDGDTVHDSCMGSGWSMEASRNLNRNYIGHEISNEWEDNYKRIQSNHIQARLG